MIAKSSADHSISCFYLSCHSPSPMRDMRRESRDEVDYTGYSMARQTHNLPKTCTFLHKEQAHPARLAPVNKINP
jgi:hypothetical protein